MRKFDHAIAAAVRLSCGVLLLLGWCEQSRAGALENYVARPDTNYSWAVATNRTSEGFAVTHLKLTSQHWKEGNWTHHVQVVRPEKIRNPQIGFLFITGDGDGLKTVDMLKVLAERAGAVAAVVTRVPNQPLYEGRKEDS